MTKQELTEIFDMFAKTSIKEMDGRYVLYGHNVTVDIIGTIWDVWLCNAKGFLHGDMTAYLGTGKLNNICSTLPSSIKVTEYDGERSFETNDIHWLKTWLYENRKALGIAKRKKVTGTPYFSRKGTLTGTV
jgi:hypothetical protein